MGGFDTSYLIRKRNIRAFSLAIDFYFEATSAKCIVHNQTLHGGLRGWHQGAASASQLMAKLPALRAQRYHSFLHLSVDIAGPIHLRAPRGRGVRTYKCYIVGFVCFAIRAIHVEVYCRFFAGFLLIQADKRLRKFVLQTQKCFDRSHPWQGWDSLRV